MKRTWILRFDAGPEIGLGHWYRCLALAKELRCQGEQNIRLWTREIALALIESARAEGLLVEPSARWDDPGELLRELSYVTLPVLILDLMDTQMDFVRAAKKHALVVSIGGNGPGRNEVDIRIDGMIPRPGYTDGFRGRHLFVGPEYVILRPIFDDPPIASINSRVERVLVALGGDASGVGIEMARMLVSIQPDVVIDVLLGPLASLRDGLPKQICCHRGVENPRPLMERADLAVISGGMTSYELMRLGIPMIFLPQVPHQRVTSRAFEEAGVGFAYDGIAREPSVDLDSWVRDAWMRISPPEVREKLSAAGRRLVDGGGLHRVVRILSDYATTPEPAEQETIKSRGAL